jgi:hypothetical protein
MKNGFDIPLLNILEEAIRKLEKMKVDAIRFDSGNESAGKRIRKEIVIIKKILDLISQEVQRKRYYREAYRRYIGKITFIEALEYKEKKYGSVDEVAKFQILQKSKNKVLKRN